MSWLALAVTVPFGRSTSAVQTVFHPVIVAACPARRSAVHIIYRPITQSARCGMLIGSYPAGRLGVHTIASSTALSGSNGFRPTAAVAGICCILHTETKSLLSFHLSGSLQSVIGRTLSSDCQSHVFHDASNCSFATPGFQQHYLSQTRFKSSEVEKTKESKFKVINGTVDTCCTDFQSNVTCNEKVIMEYKSLLKVATSGGGAKAIERHCIKNKKLLVMDRLRLLFDDIDDVLELSPLAGMGMKYGDIPRAGTVIGKYIVF